MKRRRHSPEQIVRKLREADSLHAGRPGRLASHVVDPVTNWGDASPRH
jgi:hypothetical protein